MQLGMALQNKSREQLYCVTLLVIQCLKLLQDKVYQALNSSFCFWQQLMQLLSSFSGMLQCVKHLCMSNVSSRRECCHSNNLPMHPGPPYIIILLCLMPDDFTHQGESAVTQWVNQTICQCNLMHPTLLFYSI